ncbi:MAG: hypothetical protein IT176_14470 [Acidobacteria bacterium]|nr:hypothetical protein [Acidobacteriota bacterium]
MGAGTGGWGRGAKGSARGAWRPALTIAAVVLLGAALFYAARGRWLVACALVLAALVPIGARLPRGRRGWFAVAAIVMAIGATLVFALGVDLYLHHRFADTGGYNIWGYRGRSVGDKQPGERRLVLLGGSVGFGYGVRAAETIPYYLEQRLNQPAASRRTTVVNLAWNSEGAYSFPFTLRDYDWLDYDAAILYSGYNDLFFNNQSFRRESAVFRVTGYLPILPIIPLRGWLHLENLSDTSREGRVVFHGTAGDRYAADAAEMALRIQHALERQLQAMSPDEKGPKRDAIRFEHWEYYLGSLQRAIDYALERHKTVFVVSEPFKNEVQTDQQRAVRQMLAQRYPGNPRVRYLSMETAVDLSDRTLCYDGLHLTAEGNARVADRLAAGLAPLLAQMP